MRAFNKILLLFVILLYIGAGDVYAQITTFPNSADFEDATDGDWAMSGKSYTITNSGTPTSNTGPSAARTGSYYMFSESSSGGSDADFYLDATFDFTNVSNPHLSFSYHMYGGNMSTAYLRIQVDAGAGYTTIWTENGDQGNGWIDTTLSLYDYGEQSDIKVRIWTHTGDSWESDVGIDEILVDDVNDADGLAKDPTTQVTGDTVWAYNDYETNAVNVFDFKLQDQGTADTKALDITKLVIKPGSSNTADWTDNIGGVRLYDGASYVTIASTNIADTYIEMNFTQGTFTIADGTTKDMKFYVYLNGTNITHDAILDFRIDYDDHDFECHKYATVFDHQLGASDIEGNSFRIYEDKVINFPYCESFEGENGLWTNNTVDDDDDWLNHTGTTPTYDLNSSTGPNGAKDGDRYIYVEATGGADDHHMLDIEVDFGPLDNPQIAFSYSMFGAEMNDADLWVKVDTGAGYVTIWSENGNQGTDWIDTTISFWEYQHKDNVNVRFQAQCAATNGADAFWDSDIALDKVCFKDGNGEALSYAQTPGGGQVAAKTVFAYEDTESEAFSVFSFDIVDPGTSDGLVTKVNTIVIKPGGSNTADWTNSIQDVKLHNGSGWVTLNSTNIADDAITITIDNGDLTVADGATQALTLYAYLNNSNLVDGSIMDFKIDYDDHDFVADLYHSVFKKKFGASDIEGNNITIETTTITGAQVSYCENFEGGLGMWENDSGEAEADDWTRDSGGTPSSSTGPSTANGGSYYLYTEATGNDGDEFWLDLHVDATDITSLELAFAYHMYGANMGTLKLQVDDNGGGFTDEWTMSGDKTDVWKSATVDLSDYDGKSNLTLRFYGLCGTTTSDMAIDDVCLNGSSCSYPSTQPNTASNSSKDSTGVTLTWARGNGDQVLVVMREGNSTITDPTDGVSYTANAAFGSGTDVGSNSYVVYDGTETSVSVTGLNYATTYYVEYFEYSTTGDCYQVTSPLTYNFTTDSCYIYVNDNSTDGDKWCGAVGNDANAGTAAAPYASLEKAFSAHLCNAATVIRLDKGTYNTTKENDINPDDNDDDFMIIGKDSTSVIDPVGTDNRAFYFSQNGDVKLKNFKITGAASDDIEGGVALYYENDEAATTSTLTLTGMIFSNNDYSGAGDGGAIFLEDGNSTAANLTISNCTFRGNTSTNRGGAIFVEGGTGAAYTFSNSRFHQNTTHSDHGLAIYVSTGSLDANNLLLDRNDDIGDDTGDGAIYLNGAQSHNITNSTICYNNGDDAGVVTFSSGTVTVENCILWQNSGHDFDEDAGTGVMTYCTYESVEGVTPSNSVTTDPIFIDPDNDLFDIATNSPAKDVAQNAVAPSDDITGTTRLSGGNTVVDMGAYESGNGTASCSDPTTQPSVVVEANKDSVSVDISWTDGDGDSVLVVIREGNSTITDPTDGANYTASTNWDSKGTDLGSNSYVVYEGNGTSFSLSNLEYAKTYYLEFFEYNGYGCFLTTSPLTYNFTTDSCYIYVDDATGTDDNSDDVWCTGDFGDDAGGNGTAANPYASINKVFDVHKLDAGTVVRIDNGSYNTDAERDIDPDNDDDDFTIIGASTDGVVIDPTSTYRAFYFSGNGSITLKSFTINDGHESTNPGGGIYFTETAAVTLTLTNMKLSNNKAYGTEHGGAIYAITSGGTTNLTISDCNFNTNISTSKGGAIYFSGGNASTLKIDRTYFYANESFNQGSAIKVADGASVITNCLFYENNNNNSSEDGVLNTSGGENHLVMNCTFADNIGGQDCGYTSDGAGTHTVKNCIFWNNIGDDLEQDAGTMTFSYCIYQSLDGSAPTNGGNNSTFDPKFVDAANDDYDIEESSPAVNTATETGAPSVDITNTARDVGDYDIGCYEQGNGPTFITCGRDLTWVGTTSTSWNVSTNWNPNTVPCGNNVTINDVANDPVLDTKGDCGNLTINTGALLTWSSTDSLKVSGNLDINGTATVNHTSSGVFYMSGTSKTINVESGATLSTLPITIGGTVTNETDVTFDDLIVKSGATLTTTNATNLNLAGQLDNDGTITFAGTNDTITVGEDVDNDGTITIGASSVLDITTNMDNASGKNLTLSSGKLFVGGNFTNAGTFDDSTSTVIFDGGDNSVITDADGIELYNVVINKDALGNTISSSNAITIANNFTSTQGTYKIDGGSLDIANLLTINGGKLWLSSGTLTADDQTVDMNGGTLDVDAGTVDFDNDANGDIDLDISAGIVDLVSATMNVGDDILISGTGEVQVTSGTLNVKAENGTNQCLVMSGGTLDLDGGTINAYTEYNQTGGTLEMENATFNIGSSSNALFKISGGTYNLTNGTIDIQTVNGAATEFQITNAAAAGTVNGGKVLISANTSGTEIDVDAGEKIYSLEIASTNQTTTLQDGLDVEGDITITSGTLASNNNDITIAGNWTNSATDNTAFTEGTSTVTFDGGSAQQITGDNKSTFNSITINNASGVTITKETTLKDDLTLTIGKITTTWTNKLVMDNGADNDNDDIIGGSSTSYINGPIRIVGYQGTTELFVPVGDGNHIAPIQVTQETGGGSNTWEFRYADTSARTSRTSICGAGNIEKVSDEDIFYVHRTAGTENAKVRLYWNSNSDVTETAIEDLVIAHYDWGNTCWEGTNADTSQFTKNKADDLALGTLGYIETDFYVSDFSPFAFSGRFGTTLLPVELLSFDAEFDTENEEVLLDWVTASEKDNDYFDIQRKKDGGKWSSIDRVYGAGTSAMNLYYSTVDANPYGGMSHYRLRQVDFDGNSTYSDVKSITTGFMSSVVDYTVTYDGGLIYVNLEDNKRSYYKLEVINIAGQVVYRNMEYSNQGLNTYQIEQLLGQGMYYVIMSNDSEIYSSKLIVR